MITLTTEDDQALLAERERLTHQLRAVTVEHDWLKERSDAYLRRLFAAKSEARPAARGDLFLNEAEALAPPGTSVAEEMEPAAIEVTGHRRQKRGRKPLDPHLPREIVRHELPESERICGHAGAGTPHSQGFAHRIGAGLGDHREIPGCPAAIPAGRPPGPLRRRSVAQHGGGQRRTRRRSRPASH
jgi:hypothetical protein